MPAWYGVGTGIADYTRNEPDRISELQTMYQEWPFFRTFLSNVQVLSGYPNSDYPIAEGSRGNFDTFQLHSFSSY